MSIGWKLLFFVTALSVFSGLADAAGTCIVCDDSTSTDEKCAKEPPTGSTCQAESCFISVSNKGKIKRGCVDDTDKCEDNDSCQKCTAVNEPCNTKAIAITCKKCDSTTEANCAQWLKPDDIKNQICNDGVTKCLMQIKEDKNIERRCATKNDETCVAEKNCKTCDTAGCNEGVYPTTRRRCYQCDSSSNCASLTDVSSVPCTLYNAEEKCYVFGTSETEMGRGCVSNAVGLAKCTNAKEKCIQCNTDNCNNSGFKRSQTLKCIQCTSSQAACSWGFAAADAKDCTKQIEFYSTEGCYTKKLADNKAERGCIHDVDNLECSTDCTTCNSASGCNNADAMNFSCYKCRSDQNPSCAKPLDGTSFGAEGCRNPVTSDTAGCYTENYNGIVIRSCLVDADYTTKEQCLDTSYKNCDSCKDKNCNSLKAPNSAQAATMAGAVLALCLLVLRLL